MRRYIIIYITVLCMVIGSLSGCLSKPSNRDIRDRLAIELENKYGEKFDIAEADLADTGNLGVPGKIIAYTGKACSVAEKAEVASLEHISSGSLFELLSFCGDPSGRNNLWNYSGCHGGAISSGWRVAFGSSCCVP